MEVAERGHPERLRIGDVAGMFTNGQLWPGCLPEKSHRAEPDRITASLEMEYACLRVG